MLLPFWPWVFVLLLFFSLSLLAGGCRQHFHFSSILTQYYITSFFLCYPSRGRGEARHIVKSATIISNETWWKHTIQNSQHSMKNISIDKSFFLPLTNSSSNIPSRIWYLSIGDFKNLHIFFMASPCLFACFFSPYIWKKCGDWLNIHRKNEEKSETQRGGRIWSGWNGTKWNFHRFIKSLFLLSLSLRFWLWIRNINIYLYTSHTTSLAAKINYMRVNNEDMRERRGEERKALQRDLRDAQFSRRFLLFCLPSPLI